MNLIRFLSLQGYSQSKIANLARERQILLSPAGSATQYPVTIDELRSTEVGYGDKVVIGDNTYHYRAARNKDVHISRSTTQDKGVARHDKNSKAILRITAAAGILALILLARHYKSWPEIYGNRQENSQALRELTEKAIQAQIQKRIEKEAKTNLAQQEKKEESEARAERNHESELKSITSELIQLDLDNNKDWSFVDNGTCTKAQALMSRIERLREQKGAVSFNFWVYESDLSGTTDADWNGGSRDRGYIVDGKIRAFELESSIQDYIKTCDAMRHVP